MQIDQVGIGHKIHTVKLYYRIDQLLQSGLFQSEPVAQIPVTHARELRGARLNRQEIDGLQRSAAASGIDIRIKPDQAVIAQPVYPDQLIHLVQKTRKLLFRNAVLLAQGQRLVVQLFVQLYQPCVVVLQLGILLSELLVPLRQRRKLLFKFGALVAAARRRRRNAGDAYAKGGEQNAPYRYFCHYPLRLRRAAENSGETFYPLKF